MNITISFAYLFRCTYIRLDYLYFGQIGQMNGQIASQIDQVIAPLPYTETNLMQYIFETCP